MGEQISPIPPSPNVPQVPEKTSAANVFEHLFPRNHWKSLLPFNPLNVFTYIERRVFDETLNGRFGDAVKYGQGFAERFNLPDFLDKTTIAWEFSRMVPSDEHIAYGTVSDCLADGERLGGVALKDVSWVPPEKMNLYPNPSAAVTDYLFNGLNSNHPMYDHATAKIIGVLDRDGKPRGYIQFKAGPRARKEVRLNVRKFTPIPVRL